MKRFPQFSLRELLLVVLLAGLGLASLRAGGVMASITIFLALVLTMGLAIMAFVARNEAQAFAIGFLLPVIVYAVIARTSGKRELDPYSGRLPTSQVMRPVFEAMVERTYIEVGTGKELPDYDPATQVNVGANPFGNTRVRVFETRNRVPFMLLAHVLFAMLLGYAGGKFAMAVYRRRRTESA